MNKVYRIVWSKTRRAWVVASELATGHGKSAASRRRVAPVHRHLFGGAALAVSMAAVVAPVSAAVFTVANEAELRQAILDANASGDATSTITLSADITVTDPTAFAQATQTITINAGAFTLAGAQAAGTGPGTSLAFLGGPIVVTGNVRGGAAITLGTNAPGGTGLALNGAGSVTVNAGGSVAGGTGASRRSTSTGNAGDGGTGVSTTAATVLNQGTINGGDGGYYDGAGNAGTGSTRRAGNGGTAVAMTGGELDNRGVIRGGNGGQMTNVPGTADNSYGGVGGNGVELAGGVHSNSGSIAGGTGGTGANKGGSAGAVSGGSGLVLTGGATLTNRAGATVTGGKGVLSLPSGGPASAGGAGARVANATLVNQGTIGGGSGGSSSVTGGGGVIGSGGAKVINEASILGGTSSNGGSRNSAVAFSGGNNLLELRAGSTITGNVTAGATDTLALGGATDSGFNVALIGPAVQYRGFGRYEKTGTSTWTLTGTTATVTPWTLTGGVLQISNDGNLGAPAGGLTFNGGTLQTTADFSSARAITLANDGRIVTDPGTTLTLDGVLSGNGGFTKDGAGTLVLTADNTYTGATDIDDGALHLGSGGTTGSIAGGLVMNNAQLFINRSNTVTLGGAISGAGSLSQIGAGTTILAGANSYSGGTTITGGTLQGSTTSFGSGGIVNDGALVLDQATNGVLTNLVSGTGSLTKTGSGAVTLSAGNSYTGATLVSGGTLFVNGDQSAATGITTVNAGATLGGSGILGGDVTVDGFLAPGTHGVGTFTINGNLVLGSGAALNFELGQAGVAGGAFNDLINVGGDLFLDGTLNVAISAGGDYGPGLYRLINYGGTLDAGSPGLTLGSMPAGTAQYVDTTTAGQVNLINTQGLQLRWWDAVPGSHNDSAISGGSGTWLANGIGTNINWTETGALNGPFLDESFAMFTNAGGVVEVDHSLGAITVAGMQFTVDGYRIQGDAVTLASGTNSIRVGDGSAAGAGMTATIAAELDGAGRLDKADLGTLVLTGSNSYTGGTVVSGGVLQLGDGGTTGSILGGVSLGAEGTLAFNHDGMVFYQPITGSGHVAQRGSGTLTLGGINTYSGGTTIAAGTLRGSATSFGSGDILNNAALIVEESGSGTLSNRISGSGTFTKTGAGTLTLTADNVHAGLTTITDGVLELGAGGAAGAIAGDIVNNATLRFNRADDSEHAGAITGSGMLEHTGTGTTRLTGDSNYDGETRVLAGSLRVEDGGQVESGIVRVADGVGANASLTVSGTGSRLEGAGGVAVGAGANSVGTFAIEAGGVADFGVGPFFLGGDATGHATLTVDGVGSLFQQDVGGIALFQGQGFVNVIGGGRIDNDLAMLGLMASGNATVTVAGAGSRWETGNFTLHQGTLSVLDGGAVNSDQLDLGGGNGLAASARVAGTGSQLATTAALDIGGGGSGALTIADGGRVTAGTVVTLANNVLGAGVLNIGAALGDAATGAGTLVTPLLQFGAGNGMLAFNHNDSEYEFDTAMAGTGEIVHAGATTTVISGDSSGFTGVTWVQSGTLLVNGTLGDATSALNVLPGATLGGSGLVGGDVTVYHGGTLAPGNSPGTLTLGSLILDTGVFLEFELGARQVVGGALNDLINVNGDLALGGILNVTEAPGGRFDVGVYRLINYAGNLTNYGLALGSMPAGVGPTDLYVQTEVDHQVNLIHTAGLAFRFWDGPVGHGNGVFDGNSGLWRAGGDSNWTVFDPYVNDPWATDAFAVFQGAPGTVTVDHDQGAVFFAGAQFMVDGYVIDGAALTTNTASTVIRVGDSTAASATMTATIDAEITGSGGIVKADAGILRLTGVNSYTGGTTAAGGILQVAEDANLGAVTGALTLDGGILQVTQNFVTARDFNALGTGGAIDTQAHTVELSGQRAGDGDWSKLGAGTLLLGGASSATGLTTIEAGTMRAAAADVLGAAAGFEVVAGATLELAGFDQSVDRLRNAGTVSLVGAAPGTTLTVTGNYHGDGGLLRLGTALGDNGSATDRLVLDGGSVSGSTLIEIVNFSGLGGQTSGDGIAVVSAVNGATTTAQTSRDAFALAGGLVAAGAFEYRLYAGDASRAGENWYLRSTLPGGPVDPIDPIDPVDPVDPTEPGTGVTAYRAEVPLYAAVPALLAQSDQTMLGTLHGREGDINGARAESDGHSYRVWARGITQSLDSRQQGTVSPRNDARAHGTQVGIDLLQGSEHRLGVYGGQLDWDSDVNGFASGIDNRFVGQLSGRSNYLGAYWTYRAAAGWYSDVVLQQGWHDGDVKTAARGDVEGESTLASVELGKAFVLNPHWQIEPQAQLILNQQRLDDQTIPAARFRYDDELATTARLGVRLVGDFTTERDRVLPYARVNLWHGANGTDTMAVAGPGAGTDIRSARGYTSVDVAVGATWIWNQHFSLYGEAGRWMALDDSRGQEVKSSHSASLGLRFGW